MQKLNFLSILLDKSYRLSSSLPFSRFLISFEPATVMPPNDGVYYADWGLVFLRLSLLWLLCWPRRSLSIFSLLPPSSDKSVEMAMLDEILDLILELDTLLHVVAIILMVQAVLIGISLDRECP